MLGALISFFPGIIFSVSENEVDPSENVCVAFFRGTYAAVSPAHAYKIDALNSGGLRARLVE